MKCIECNYDIEENESYSIINGSPVHDNGCRTKYERRLDGDELILNHMTNVIDE